MQSRTFPVTQRNKVKRMRERATYDVDAVHAMLDAALFCHIAYVVDGQPYCTPTLFWRRGDSVVWHGSVGSRMLREQLKGVDVCLTVTFLDGIVMTRTAFRHAVNYRSAMIFGRATLIDDPEEKRLEAEYLIDNFLPGRSARVVPPTPEELMQASFVRMPIDQASAKVRDFPASQEAAEFRDTDVWAGEIPIRMEIGAPTPCPELRAGIEAGPELAQYRAGDRLDDALLRIRRSSKSR